MIMLVCFLVQGLIPPNAIASHDLKFFATLLLPKRSVLVLKNQLRILLIHLNLLFFSKKK